MKNFYEKYIANACGIASAVSSLIYLLLIFFAGINALLIPPMFLNGDTLNLELVSLFSQIMHILSVAFLFMFYIKYFSKDTYVKTAKISAIVFSLITVILTVLSYNIEHLFLLTAVNGTLVSVFLFGVCLGDFCYISDRNNPLVKIARTIMTMAVLSAFLFILSASTYYEITAAVVREALGKFLSVRKNYALSFIMYSLAYVLQIVQFAFLYIAENRPKKTQIAKPQEV